MSLADFVLKQARIEEESVQFSLAAKSLVTIARCGTNGFSASFSEMPRHQLLCETYNAPPA